MARITADPDLLDRVARELINIAKNLDIQGGNLDKTGKQTDAIWQSSYTNQFLESVNKTKNKIDYSVDNIRKAAALLRRTADEVRRAEREIQQMSTKKG